MFTELHFEHNTVCQPTTDEELLQSPFRDNGDTNIIIPSPQGKCENQIKKSVYHQNEVIFILFPTWISNKRCPSNSQAVTTIIYNDVPLHFHASAPATGKAKENQTCGNFNHDKAN